MNESIVIYFSCDIAVQAVWTILTRRGFQVVRSFDLRSALAAHADCPCPHHGTAHCNCQFIVLLIYSTGEIPVVVTLHGRDEQTEMKIVPEANTLADPDLVEQVIASLTEAALTLSAVLSETELAYVE